MQRRILVSTILVVLAALVVSGLGTLFFARLNARDQTRDAVADQAESLVPVFQFVPFQVDGNDRPFGGENLGRIARGLDLNGVGVVIFDGLGRVVEDELPEPLSIDDLDVDALLAGETVTGSVGADVFAAAPARETRAGFVAVVAVDTPDTSLGPAVPWFLLSSVITVALGSLVAVRLSRRLSEPVTQAQETTQRIASGDLAARVPEPPQAANDELAQLSRSINRMAETLERSRGLERQFLLSVSHDLRTPMTSIQGYAEALTDGAIADPERAGEVILAEARRLDRLVRDLLELSRLDARHFTLQMASRDLGELADQAVAGFRRHETARSVSIETVTPGGVRAEIDADRFTQIVANLLENALRYARERVLVSVEAVGERAVLSVADDGPGISDADLPHVFERLYVSQHSPVEKESGSGLGLAIVRELAEAMGGTATAERASLGGAELRVNLPLDRG